MGANSQTSVPAFTAGQVLTAQQQNWINTGVPVFDNTAQRDAAFGGTGEKVLAEGQMCYIEAAPKQYQVYNGTAWVPYMIEFTTYTPTFTNFTIGNGTINMRYAQMGKLVVVQGRIDFGSTTSITGTPTITFPVTASASSSAVNLGNIRFVDANGSIHVGGAMLDTTARFYPAAYNASTTFTYEVAMSPTIPFTWVNTDYFLISVMYEAA